MLQSGLPCSPMESRWHSNDPGHLNLQCQSKVHWCQSTSVMCPDSRRGPWKTSSMKVGRSQMGPFLSMKVARNIFAWNDFKPKEVHGKRPGFIRKFVRKWCTTLSIYPNYILHIRKKLTKRGKGRKQGRKHNFSKFLTLANFSHSRFAIFPFKWLYELYKLYKHFNHLPLKRDGHKRSLWF